MKIIIKKGIKKRRSPTATRPPKFSLSSDEKVFDVFYNGYFGRKS